MWVGDVVADRFVLERPAASGGMGTVFRATDRLTGDCVAVKVMDSGKRSDAERFRLEARVLSELAHPAVVRYIGHGQTESGEPYLAMEWLDGEDLARRLAGSGLTANESLVLARRVTEGLALAHSMGIVHRDVKPSNIFLVEGDPRRAKLLDFGVARLQLQTRPITRTGAVIGTVGYMAPEQARGDADVDARADVFALGCVLFECLTGRPAFAGQHAVAVLAKVLSQEPPRVSELRPAMGDVLDRFIAGLVAKERAARPADAAAVLRAMQVLAPVTGAAPPGKPRSQSGLTDAERRVISVILAEPAGDYALSSGQSNAEMTPNEEEKFRHLAARCGGEAALLKGGALLVVFSEGGTATDQAMRAAECALSLHHQRSDLSIAVATGRAERISGPATGEAIDRAAAILRETTWADGEWIRIDELTAGLLDPRFDVRGTGSNRLLVGKHAEFGSARLLLGKPTPCVGRDKELALLDATLAECVSDSVSRVVLVVAPPGVGKSRLSGEFLTRVRQRGEARVLAARADPMARGASLALAQCMVRQAAGIHDGDVLEVRRARLMRHLESIAASSAVERLAEFLGEMIDAPSDGAPSPVLHAARGDPQVMREQQRRTFLAWLEAETRAAPLVIVLEDLHWGDAPSVGYIEEALRTLGDRSLFVLALARPELHGQFPALWSSASPQEIRLGGLTSRAAERLIVAVLGERASADMVTRVVRLAEGNAFYLEELIRRVAEGDTDLPETVLAMAQSRLDRLEPEARRVLRAASVFGETVWVGAIATLLGDASIADEWLDALVSRELLLFTPESRFAGERQYCFRHALLRDAAYAMLTDEDRINAHALAGQWLERAGEGNPIILAEHFERGGEPARAIPWVVRAAKSALDAGDVGGAVVLAKRGVALGAQGEALGLLLAIHGEALSWDAQWDAVLSVAREARSLLPERTAPWWRATAAVVAAATAGGKPAEAAAVIQTLLDSPPDLAGQPLAAARACNWLVIGLVNIGQGQRGLEFLRRIGLTDTELPDVDPVFLAWLLHSACGLAILVDADLGRAIRMGTWARAVLADAGDPLGEASVHAWLGAAAWETGRADDTEFHWQKVKDLLGPSGGAWLRLYADFYLAAVRLRRGEVDGIEEQLAPVRASVDASASQLAHALTVELRLRQGKIADAIAAATVAAEGPSAVIRPTGAAILARIHLASGRPREALEAADRGLAESSTVNPHWKTWLLVCRAEALHDLGDAPAARATITEARERVERIAETLDEPRIRESFLTNVEANVRALELAGRWGSA